MCAVFIFFSQGETVQNIVLRSLPDIIPEGQETFFMTLTSVSGGASLRPGFTQARIVIPANDDAFGVLSVSPANQRIFTAESRTFTIK